MKLLKVLRIAGGIDIDGTFIRNFNLDEDDEDNTIDITMDVDDGELNFTFSMDDIEGAVQQKDGTWHIEWDMGDWRETVSLTPYSLEQIK